MNFNSNDNQAGYDEDIQYADALAAALEELSEPLGNYGRVYAEKEALQKQKDGLAQRGGISESFGRLICYGIASVFAVILLIILNLLAAPVFVFILFGFVAAAAYLVVGTIIIQYQQNTHLNVSDLSAAIDEREDKLIAYDKELRSYRGVDVPIEYRNRKAISFFQDVLRSHEAFSIDEAIELYESELRLNPALADRQSPEQLQQQLAQTALLPQGDDDLMSRARNAIEYMGGIKIFAFITALVFLSFIVTGVIAGI
ncbi:MAG: hypothetical protein IKD90_09160 [Clostridiales bacterium]|nr:hypothetical protein [Clostridiales bacterium]